MGGKDNAVLVHDRLPSVTYNFRLASANAFGQSEWSPLAAVTMPDRGSCGNAADLAVQRAKYSTSESSRDVM